MSKTLIIAEVGVNHNGDIKIAEKLIEAAANAGADIVKFQSFISSELTTDQALQAEYQIKNTKKVNTQKQMLKNLEFNRNQFEYIRDCCVRNNIEFLSTAFDSQSLKMLNSFDMKRIKIPSGEITNFPYLLEIGALGKPVILSTGISNLIEINQAISALLQSGMSKKEITILHCTSEYPAPIEEVNLNAMSTIRETFGTNVGYSDHTEGIEVSIGAVALGAKIIEKHITLDKNLDGPDHKASIEINEFKMMINCIRSLEIALGSFEKKPSKSELKNKNIIRKSIVASKDIKKGDTFSADNLTSKRPGNGLSPMFWNQIIGDISTRDYKKDDQIIS